MNREEAVILCRAVRALCPSQQWDSHTPDAWALVLDDVRIEDAQDALKALKGRQTWIDVSDILQEVRKARAKRIERYGHYDPPAELDPDDTEAYTQWLADTRRAIGDGDTPERAAIEVGQRPRELKQLEPTSKESK